MLDSEQHGILVFPSKAAHATAPNRSSTARISISGDVSLMLSNSEGIEHLMPDLSQWQRVD